MRSKNSKSLTEAERKHIERVKSLPCSVCGLDRGCSDAHHPKQGYHFLVIALCKSCHQGRMGIHGEKIAWNIAKMDEWMALNETLKNLSKMS